MTIFLMRGEYLWKIEVTMGSTKDQMFQTAPCEMYGEELHMVLIKIAWTFEKMSLCLSDSLMVYFMFHTWSGVRSLFFTEMVCVTYHVIAMIQHGRGTFWYIFSRVA